MQHVIEEAVKVYLKWNDEPGRWALDRATTDGAPLDSAYDAPLTDECLHEADSAAAEHDLTLEHDAVYESAIRADLPTANDVMHMLAEALMPDVAVDGRPVSVDLQVQLRVALMRTFGLDADESRLQRALSELLPIVASVDENAHRRGIAAATDVLPDHRQQVLLSMRPGQEAGHGCRCGWHSHTETFADHIREVASR